MSSIGDPEKARWEMALEALRAAGREAVLLAKRTGTPVVTWRDGRVAKVDPDEFLPQQKTEFDPTAGTGPGGEGFSSPSRAG